MFLDLLFLIIGFILLIKGATLLVSGSSFLARKLHVPPLIIGLTIVSIGTSLPELSVNIKSSIDGYNDMALGNIIGSNIFDISVVVGLSAIIIPLTVSKDISKYDTLILLLIYGILLIFMFWITPFVISRMEGIIFILLTILYITLLIVRTNNEMIIDNNINYKYKWYIYLIGLILGLFGLVAGAKLSVDGAVSIAKYFGMSELMVSLTIVSIGTSLPEVVTSAVASKRGESDIAVGNAIGSCIFNIILIIGVSSIISPITFNKAIIIDVLVMILISIFLYLIVINKNRVNRKEGIILLILYACYLIYLILTNYINV